MTLSRIDETATQRVGSLEVIFGPMFSGKSTELQRRLRRHTMASRRVLVVKYAGDNRYDLSLIHISEPTRPY